MPMFKIEFERKRKFIVEAEGDSKKQIQEDAMKILEEGLETYTDEERLEDYWKTKKITKMRE